MRAAFGVASLLLKEIFRKKDFYVALILIGVILFYAAQFKFYNVENISRYLMDIGLQLIFLCPVILTVSLSARQVPSEREHRTLPVLMAKPIRRSEYVFGKFFGSFLAGGACFVIFYGLFLAIVSTKADSLRLVMICQTAYLFLLNLFVIAAMTSGFSYRLTTSANVSITLVIYILINTYGPGLKKASENLFWLNRMLGEIFYYVLPHFEFFDMRQRFIHEWGPLPWGLAGFLTLYAFIYSFIFLMIGWLKFRHENL